MASTVSFALPTDLDGVPIPSEENIDALDMSPEHTTARWFYEAKNAFTAKAAIIFEPNADFSMRRFITLRPRQTKAGKVMPVMSLTRPQAADSLDKKACKKCKDNTGIFNAYVTLNAMSPGCASCDYGGQAKHCSLVTVTDVEKRSRDDSSSDDHTFKRQKKKKESGKKKSKKEKSGQDFTTKDITEALKSLDQKSLRTMKNIFEALLDGDVFSDSD
ncbi:hypothetical protein EDB81DRAFT_832370 [Dactylonectria macrodidyma]|uniref:Uncharacterized protein n=1 Tax=Dactylonectria macrodidyma TaxID=307937 RepID=A0A9P9I7R8_9HYPO|nr:hypothetical protein EDB81DRAFT_832370 [Dactylonectria macrodidyma]